MVQRTPRVSDPQSSQNLLELSPRGLFSGPSESTAQLMPKNAIADFTWLLQSYMIQYYISIYTHLNSVNDYARKSVNKNARACLPLFSLRHWK